MITLAIRTPSEGSIPSHLCGAVAAGAVYVCLAVTTCLGTEFQYAVDNQPEQIAPNLWRFSVPIGVKPVGQLAAVWSQYDFASPTEGIEVDYDFNGSGIDYSDGRAFWAIAPTLFDPLDGYINGWEPSALRDGTFTGLVYATAPLAVVHFMIAADQLVPVRHPRLKAGPQHLETRRSREARPAR